MRLHRFFVGEQLSAEKEVRFDDTDLIHQWKNVFRLSKGDGVILLDNTGFEYAAEISLITKDEAVVSVGARSAVKNMIEKEVWLCASVIKKDHFEWIVEKATELDVSHIVPVLSERSEKKNLNMERGKKIVKEASEQSGRGTLPTLHDITDLKNAIDMAKKEGNEVVAFHLEGSVFSKETYTSAKKIALFVGPEGGWSDKEIELFRAENVTLCSLGNQVLRAETAAIAASALVLL